MDAALSFEIRDLEDWLAVVPLGTATSVVRAVQERLSKLYKLAEKAA